MRSLFGVVLSVVMLSRSSANADPLEASQAAGLSKPAEQTISSPLDSIFGSLFTPAPASRAPPTLEATPKPDYERETDLTRFGVNVVAITENGNDTPEILIRAGVPSVRYSTPASVEVQVHW